MLPVECIARGYLAGLGLASYRETGAISGVRLPPGLGEGSRLPEPVFTPTTKAAAGHDEPMTYDEVAALVGEPVAAELRRVTLEVYRRGAALAAARGILIADTKLEFGLLPDGTLMLADEVLTPDSSRFWLASEWQPGRPAALAGQAVRPGLVGRPRLGPPAAGPGHPGRGGGGDPGPLPGAVREADRP